MSRLLTTLGALALLSLASACGGYAELPLPVREMASLESEGVDLYPGAIGQVQLVTAMPEDVVGPLFVVGPPIVSQGASVTVSWSIGRCPGFPPPPEGDDPLLRLCVALFTAEGTLPPLLGIDAVVEERHSGRRFTVGTDIEVQ